MRQKVEVKNNLRDPIVIERKYLTLMFWPRVSNTKHNYLINVQMVLWIVGKDKYRNIGSVIVGMEIHRFQ